MLPLTSPSSSSTPHLLPSSSFSLLRSPPIHRLLFTPNPNSNPHFRLPRKPLFSPQRRPLSRALAARDPSLLDEYDQQRRQEEGVEEEEGEESGSEVDSGGGIEIEVTKVGRNRRRIRARVGVGAELETVWGVLTDYEGLADFIPGLAVSELVEKGESFARLYQVGQQDLALGFKFNAKGVLDCYEKELEVLPSGRRRDIEFRMVEGDFHTFEGVWSIEQNESNSSQVVYVEGLDSQTTLSYVVELEPKLWLPVRLLEGRLCREVRNNLSSVRDEAQRVQRIRQSTPSSW